MTGDGSTTGGFLDRDGSGGVLNRTTGHSILLTNASNVTLRQMNVTNTATNFDAVRSAGGGTIVLSAVLLQNLGFSGWTATNLAGTNRVDHNSRIENWQTLQSNGIVVTNTSTNFTSFTVDRTLFTTSANGSDGFLFVANGATSGTVNVTSSEFTLLDQDAVQVSNDGSGAITSLIESSNFHDADTTSGDGNNTVFLSQAGSGDHNFTIGGDTANEGNTFTNLGRLGVLAGVVQVNVNGAGSGGAQATGTIQHNTITGSTGRRGIVLLAEASGGAQGGHNISILDNVVSQTFHGSIYAIFSALNNSDNLNNQLTISRNNVNTTVGNSGGDSASAIEVEMVQGGTPSDVAATLMVENNTAVNNSTSGLGDTIEIVNRADLAGATATMNATAWGNTVTKQAGGTNHAFEIRNFSAGTQTMTLDLNAANVPARRNNVVSGEPASRTTPARTTSKA